MSRCAVAALLGAGGPVRVSVRPCCVLALVGGSPPADPSLRESFVCAAQEAGADEPALLAGAAADAGSRTLDGAVPALGGAAPSGLAP